MIFKRETATIALCSQPRWWVEHIVIFHSISVPSLLDVLLHYFDLQREIMDNFDEPWMLHFVPDCWFRSESLRHHDFSNSLHHFMTKRSTNRDMEWFPLMPHNLYRLQALNAELPERLTTQEFTQQLLFRNKVQKAPLVRALFGQG